MLANKTILGAIWTVSSRLGGRLIDVVTLIVLARTLTPADFGLTALAMSLTVIIDTIFEVPLISALTRLNTVEKAHLDTAFTLGVLRGLLLSLVIVMIAWPFSIVYSDPRLIPLIVVLALAPISRGLYSPATVHFIRRMDFRPVFIAEFAGRAFAATVAILVAYLGGGYWAIAVSSVLNSVATVVITYIIAPYRPALTLRHLSDFSAFLGWFSTSQVVSALSWQFDRALLGYFVPKSNFGQFAMASDLSVLPMQSLIGPAMQPVFAAFSRIKEDRIRLRQGFLKASRLTMMLAMPATVGMSVTADLIVNVILGPKWTQAAFLLQGLSLAISLAAYYQTLYSLALTLDRPIIVFKLTFIELCARIVIVSVGLYFFSIEGAVGARAVVTVIVFAGTLFYVRKLLGIEMLSQLANLWRPAVACIVMAMTVLFARHHITEMRVHMLFELLILAVIGLAAYGGVLYTFGVRITDYFAMEWLRRPAPAASPD